MMKMLSFYRRTPNPIVTGKKLASKFPICQKFSYEKRRFYHVNRPNNNQQVEDSNGGLCSQQMIHRLRNGFGCIWRFVYALIMSPVPYTRRTRFAPLHQLWLHRAIGVSYHKWFMEQVKQVALPKSDPQSVRVRWILKDITDALRRDLKEDVPRIYRRFKWEVFVVDSPLNWQMFSDDSPVIACSVPGGNGNITITVDSLQCFERDDEIATLLAHQVGYIVADHEGEYHIRLAIMNVNQFIPKLLFTYLIPKPRIVDEIRDAQFSLLRKIAMEADYIGMRLIAAAGYDPRVAPSVYEKIDFLQRMEAEHQPRDDDLFETRPSGKRRALALAQVMEESLAVYEKVKAKHTILPREEGGLRLIPKD